MKSHEKKNIDKTRVKRWGKTMSDKKSNKKREKNNKILSKNEKEKEKLDKKEIKKKEPKINVLAYELVTSTLFYLMLTPW
jgi:hypothetical protein